MNHNEWLEQADLFSAGVLSEEETQAVRDRITQGDSTSQAMQVLIAENEEALSVLGLGLPQTAPPGHLKDQILKRAFQTPQTPKGRDYPGVASPFFWLLVLSLLTLTVLIVGLLFFRPTKTPERAPIPVVVKAEVKAPVPVVKTIPSKLPPKPLEQLPKDPPKSSDFKDPFAGETFPGQNPLGPEISEPFDDSPSLQDHIAE